MLTFRCHSNLRHFSWTSKTVYVKKNFFKAEFLFNLGQTLFCLFNLKLCSISVCSTIFSTKNFCSHWESNPAGRGRPGDKRREALTGFLCSHTLNTQATLEFFTLSQLTAELRITLKLQVQQFWTIIKSFETFRRRELRRPPRFAVTNIVKSFFVIHDDTQFFCKENGL